MSFALIDESTTNWQDAAKNGNWWDEHKILFTQSFWRRATLD